MVASRRLFFCPIPIVSPGFTLATRFTAGSRLNTELALKPGEALHYPAAGDAKDTGNEWRRGGFKYKRRHGREGRGFERT